jgi:hypothetical protein
VDEHQGKQERVPIARPKDTEARRSDQGARLAARKAAGIVDAPVVRREHPGIGRQIEDRDRARPEAAMRLFQGTRGIDVGMAEDVERDVGGERSAADRHLIDGARKNRPSRLGLCHAGGHRVVFEADRRPAGDVRPHHPQHAAGAASGIEDRAAGPRSRKRPGELNGDQAAQAAIPPHAVFDRMHLLVFGPFHEAASPGKSPLPVRL